MILDKQNQYLFHSFQMKILFTFWIALKLINTCTYNDIFEGKKINFETNYSCNVSGYKYIYKKKRLKKETIN